VAGSSYVGASRQRGIGGGYGNRVAYLGGAGGIIYRGILTLAWRNNNLYGGIDA